MAAFEITLEFVLIGVDHGDIFIGDTETSSFGMIRRGVMRLRRSIVGMLFHLGVLVREAHVEAVVKTPANTV